MPTETSATPLPVPALRCSSPYRPPDAAPWVDLRLDGNEGAPPPSALLARLAPAGCDLMRRYPDDGDLQSAVARRLGVKADRVLITAGGDDAIDRVCRAYLGPGRTILVPEPTFEMIERYARLTGGGIERVPWFGGPFPAGAILSRIDARTRVIAVVTPNNPTGSVASPGDLERLARAAPGAVLLVDLAYTEFADEDLTPEALALPNAVVIRSMSKAWGLAGLRIGYAAGPPGIIRVLRAVGHPYAVARPSLLLALHRLDQGREVDAFVERVRIERGELAGLLRTLGAAPIPSKANFVLARFGDAPRTLAALGSLGIAVRGFGSRPGLQDCLRITCPGEPAAFERLGAALKTVLAPQALLLDMDGVLADVSGSYRRCIRETAATFGVCLQSEDIADFKLDPGANNDWQVTLGLLRRHGIDASLPEITDRFERLYQGDRERTGLRQAERLIPSRALLERLSARLPLAVVTGRPRRDAERFLEENGISDLIAERVCLEDARPKPDPAPVRLALSRLGVERAWMLGDTPDDVLAARRAGVLPLGLVAPGDDPARSRPALLRTGAACVLDRWQDLEERLP